MSVKCIRRFGNDTYALSASLIRKNKIDEIEGNMLEKNIKEVIVYFALVIGLSYLIFWGPIALLKIPTVNLVDGERGPIWAIVLFIIGGFVPFDCWNTINC